MTFTGTANDADDGDISASLAWTSSLDGSIGSGASFSTSSLSLGSHTITAEVTDSGLLSGSDAITINVTPEGQNGPQDAVYDAGLGAPRCVLAGSSCDSLALLDGRGTVGPEPNQPSTIDACTDGTSGTYHSDESNDALVVSTLDGSDFTEGATVQVDSTVYAWSTGTSDHLDLYYTADANNPSWTLITTIDLTTGGTQTLSAQYTLPAGSLQAVRANFRYNGSQSSCSGGSYDDADDLVFAVGGAGPDCTVDADCDNGLFCDGAETCNAGTCEVGTAVSCGDGVSCTVDSCNEGTDSCDNVANDSLCDNGLFCDGTETCDAVNDCQAGSDPCGAGQTCNETTDICEGGGTPVTVTFTSIGAEDGWVRESNETSNVGGSSNSGGAGRRPIRPGDYTQDRQFKSILSFDTSSIPASATIQSATLRLRRGLVRGSDPFASFGTCNVDVMSGGFSGSTALQAADFQAAATATAAASLSAPAANLDWSEGAFNAAGLAAVNVSGTTQVRVSFTLDDNDNATDDQMGYYSGDNASAANHPQLVVTYLP